MFVYVFVFVSMRMSGLSHNPCENFNAFALVLGTEHSLDDVENMKIDRHNSSA